MSEKQENKFEVTVIERRELLFDVSAESVEDAGDKAETMNRAEAKSDTLAGRHVEWVQSLSGPPVENTAIVNARRVGQAIADGHDNFIKESLRPIGTNPCMISDDAWLIAVGRAAIKAVEELS